MPRELIIDGHYIADDTDCYVIAEIGHNHQGNLDTAKELFRAAKECGANAVKLQKRDNRTLYTTAMYNKPYDHENSFGLTYGEHRDALEFGREEYRELQGYARELGLTIFATAFDFPSADFLAELGMPAFKIASGDLKNIPLIKYVARFQKPLIISTGGATMEDVQRAYDVIMPINSKLCILQCTASYPCPYEEMNLRVITTFRERFPNTVIGLSAHDNGISMSLVAYVMGARVIEKHFTLNRAMKGTDHAFSLERPGLRKLTRDLQRARMAFGDGIKRPYASEKSPLDKMGKKLVVARPLPAGHVLSIKDIAIKSPNDGLPPYELYHLVGKVTRRALVEEENISYNDLVDA
jgi:N-acetylneuraminate synthase/sialic acid synthase